MITAKIDFKCIMPGCGNKQSWYVMPLDEKVKSGDKVHSVDKYHLQCKKCGQDYILKFNIKKLNNSKKK